MILIYKSSSSSSSIFFVPFHFVLSARWENNENNSCIWAPSWSLIDHYKTWNYLLTSTYFHSLQLLIEGVLLFHHLTETQTNWKIDFNHFPCFVIRVLCFTFFSFFHFHCYCSNETKKRKTEIKTSFLSTSNRNWKKTNFALI